MCRILLWRRAIPYRAIHYTCPFEFESELIKTKQLEIQCISHTDHVSHARWPQEASACHTGKRKHRIFPSLQKVPLDTTAQAGSPGFKVNKDKI